MVALGEIKEPQAIAAILSVLKSDDSQARQSAATALGEARDSPSVARQ